LGLDFKNFSIFSLRVKKNLFGSGQKVPGSASYFLQIKSMLGSGQGPSLAQRLAGVKLEMGIDPTWAYFWLAVNKGLTCVFLTRPIPDRTKNWKNEHFLEENFLDLEVADPIRPGSQTSIPAMVTPNYSVFKFYFDAYEIALQKKPNKKFLNLYSVILCFSKSCFIWVLIWMNYRKNAWSMIKLL